MTRRGMALLAVLWMVVLLGGLAGVGVGRSREGSLHARNRIALTRAAWAREGCLHVLLGRLATDSAALHDPMSHIALDSLDLGQEVWCRARLTDPGAQVNINHSSTSALEAMLGDSALAYEVVRGQPWLSVEQLPGYFDRWRPLLTIRGTGRINLQRAPVAVMTTVVGASAERIAALREGGVPSSSVEELLSRVGRLSREGMPDLPRLLSETTVKTEALVAEIEGHVGERPVVARMTVVLVPAGQRWAIVRREVE